MRRRKRMMEELDQDIRDHIELETQDNIGRGMSPEAARYAALRKFGNVARVKEETGKVWSHIWLEQFVQDLRFAAGSLRKNPGFATVTILTLALGIGACTTIFSIVNSVLIRSLPYEGVRRLVYLFTPIPRFLVPAETMMPSYADFLDLKKQSHSIAAMTDFDQKVFTLTTGGENREIGAALVDETFFSTLQSLPELGRTIDATDNLPGHDSVVMVSHALWQSMFAANRDVLTKSLQLDGRSYRIIGVMPANFQYPHNTDIPYLDPRIAATQLWVPLVLSPQQKANRDDSGGWVIARLRQGVSVGQAQAELGTSIARLDRLHDPFTRGAQALLKPFLQFAIGPVRPLMCLLSGAVSLVLLIACGNAASLLLARASSRIHELGMRATLGASRGRMIRQMLAESLLLGLGGGCVGMILAGFQVHSLLRMNPGNIPRLETASLDSRVLFFCVGLSILTCLLFGTLPALAASRINVAEFLKSGGSRGTVGSHTRLRNGVIVGEISLVVILLACAGLLLRSYINVMSVDAGFARSAVSLRVDVNAGYQPQQLGILFRRLIGKIGSLPGIEEVGVIDGLPLTPYESLTVLSVNGYANRQNQLVSVREASPNYFSAMSTPLLQGRFFSNAESAGQNPVVMVNQAFARTYFAGRNPIGQRISLHAPNPSWYTVVGVVANQRSKLEDGAVPTTYQPFVGERSAYLVMRSQLPPEVVASMVGTLFRTSEPDLVGSDFYTMGELYSGAAAQRRFQATMLTAFAAIAMALGVVGIYGLLAYSVKQRAAEIGLRIALGASRQRVLGMIVRQGLQLAIIGVILGEAGALALTRILASSLYGVSAFDPLTFAAAPALLLLVAIAACLVPAMRAASVDPMRTLRYE
jgi:putative ABC transport system permease protein